MVEAKDRDALESLAHCQIALLHGDRGVALYHAVHAALHISTPGAVLKVIEAAQRVEAAFAPAGTTKG